MSAPVRDAYDARDADGDRWRDEMGWQPQQRPPVNGARRLLPPNPPMSQPPAPADDDWGTARFEPRDRTRGYDDTAWRRDDGPASAMTGRGSEPPASPLRRSTRSDAHDDARPGSPQPRAWSSLPPPPPSMPPLDRASLPEEAPGTMGTADEHAPRPHAGEQASHRYADAQTPRPQAGEQALGSSADASAIQAHGDSDGAPARTRRSGRQRSAAGGGQPRATIDYVATAVRRSVPVRTLLFVLPPLVLPPLAFDLSLGATTAVALLLLWLVAATAALCMIMLEGSRHVAVRALGERLTRLSDGTDAQGSAVGPDGTGSHDRAAPTPATPVPATAAASARATPTSATSVRATPTGAASATAAAEQADRRGRLAGADAGISSHWPQQSGQTSREGEQDDRYGRPAAPDPDWGESRWRQ